MMSFQDAPDENIEHDEKMELRFCAGEQLKITDRLPPKSRFSTIIITFQ